MTTDRARHIHISFDDVKGPTDRTWRRCIGSDRAIIHLRPEHQRDLRVVRKECGFEYVRFHGVLNEEMGVCRKTAAGIEYDWSNIDAVYDSILELGMKPFVELGFMPEPLASGDQTIFWWKGNVTPPRSYEQWGTLIEALVRHWTDRYGRGEVARWFFEVWNEPNLDGFWTGTRDDYFRLYATTARAVRRVAEEYRVGGPATAGCAWFPELIDFCAANEVPIDFIAGHHYGALQGFLDEFGKTHTTLASDPRTIIDFIREHAARIRASAMPHLPLHVTEWSTSYSPRDASHDSYQTCAYILQKLKHLEGYVASMSYWAFSDQFEEPGPPSSPFHGGFGLLNAQGIKKPAFFAYQFLNRLADTRLRCDDPDAWACRDDRGVQVLVYDFRMPHQDAPNHTFYTRDLPAADLPAVRITVDDLPPGEYVLHVTRVGYRGNDVYTAYLDLDKPEGLPHAPCYLPDGIADALRGKCSGEPMLERRVRVKAGVPEIVELPMKAHDVYFVELARVS